MVSVLQIFKKCWVSLWAPEDGTVFLCHSCTNANVERLFSLIQMQWSKERNCLAVESVKRLAIVKYNFHHFTCVAFHSYLLKHPDILKKSGQQKNIHGLNWNTVTEICLNSYKCIVVVTEMCLNSYKCIVVVTEMCLNSYKCIVVVTGIWLQSVLLYFFMYSKIIMHTNFLQDVKHVNSR